ncbi:MAG: VWA domain-containing protein [Lachnospiraceae bacterium]|nr:VWA domain-containing protein [Lachnospiraceae bacterium]
MKRKIMYFAAIFLLLFSIIRWDVFAQEKLVEEDIYIVFVVDHSGSMNEQDSQNVISDTLKAFVDTLQSEEVQVGYIAYNDRIITSHQPVSIQDKEQGEKLKEAIGEAPNKGETDIGIGLGEAYRMLEKCQGKRMIVLISDGETDLTHSDTGRIKEDSDRDVQEIVLKCREGEIPISTIFFGEEKEANVQELKDVSMRTAGKSYLIQETDELPGVLCDVLYSGPSYSVYEAGSSIYGEGNQKISYEPAVYADELTVLLLSDKDINHVDIVQNAETENVTTTETPSLEISGKYAIGRLRGVKGPVNIGFDTGQSQRMTVYIIGRRSITPILEWQEEIYKNQLLDFKIRLEDRNRDAVKNVNYDTAAWQAEFKNLQTGEVIQAEIIGNGQELSGTVCFHNSGEYLLSLNFLENVQSTYISESINVLNVLPGSISSKEVGLLTISGQQTVTLKEYFTDSDDDTLYFELQEVPEDIVKAEIQGTLLLIEPEGRGRGEIKLLISDGEGSLVGSIPVRVKSLPEAYWQVLVALICVLAFCIIKIWTKRNKVILIPEQMESKNEGAFTGKLNAYFTLLPEEMEEIPPLTFALHPIREKKIAMADMFSDYPELIDVLTLDEIYLFPAENRQMILYHKSDSTIMIGNSIVCRKMQYLVSYGNVIYITSKDGTCELEVHYISMI